MEEQRDYKLDDEWALDDETLKSLVVLNGDVNFVKFKEVSEHLLIMRATDFLKGAKPPEGIQNAQDYYRGQGAMWKAILRVVDAAEASLNAKTHE